MIESILHLFKIHGKMILGNPPIIVQDMFGKRPESFNAIDVVFSFLVDHVFGMIDGVMFAQSLEGVVASKGVRVVDRALPGFLSDHRHQLLLGDMLHHARVDLTIALQKAKYDIFTLGSPSTHTLASAAKIALVHLNLSIQFATLKLGYMVDRFSKFLVDTGNRLIIGAKIVRETIGRLLLIESLHDSNFGTQTFQRLLLSARLVATANVSTLRSINLKRTAENTLLSSQKVGHATENVLSSLCHMDILVPYGYETH